MVLAQGSRAFRKEISPESWNTSLKRYPEEELKGQHPGNVGVRKRQTSGEDASGMRGQRGILALGRLRARTSMNLKLQLNEFTRLGCTRSPYLTKLPTRGRGQDPEIKNKGR